MIIPLLPEEKIYLSRLDRNTKLALKKLFINASFERPPSYETSFLAAQRIAINMIYDIFHDLENIRPDSHDSTSEGNVI